MSNETLQIILAIIGSGSIGAIVSGAVTLISKQMDKKSGNALKLDKIEKKLDEHIAQSYRNKILTFQNECIRGDRHTYEQFSEVIEAIENYENYCKENKVNNQKCVLAIEYIKEIYRQCQNTSDFAPMWNTQAIINEAEFKAMMKNRGMKPKEEKA